MHTVSDSHLHVKLSLVDSAPTYLTTFCTLLFSLPGRVSLRNAACGLLLVPHTHVAVAQSRSFAYVRIIFLRTCCWYLLLACPAGIIFLRICARVT